MQIDSKKDIFILEFSDSGTFRINSKKKNKSNSDDEDANNGLIENNNITAGSNSIEEENTASNSIYPTGKIKIR